MFHRPIQKSKDTLFYKKKSNFCHRYLPLCNKKQREILIDVIISPVLFNGIYFNLTPGNRIKWAWKKLNMKLHSKSPLLEENVVNYWNTREPKHSTQHCWQSHLHYHEHSDAYIRGLLTHNYKKIFPTQTTKVTI